MSFDNTRRVTRLALAVASTLSGVAVADEEIRPTETLSEVVVTAQKRSEKILDVPISMTAFTESTLRDAGANQLADVLSAAPGVSIVDNGSGQQSIEIRGISAAQGNSPVGYYLDELPFSYLGATQLPDVRTYDVQRVEVLRGPQGTLYGDGSLGGTIRILTNDPDLKHLQASADLGVMGTEHGTPSNSQQGMINLPLIQDTLALRLVGSREILGGWVDNTVTGVRNQNERTADTYRGKLRYSDGDRLDVVVSAWETKEHVLGDNTSLPDLNSIDPVSLNTTRYDLYNATVRYRFDAFDLVSATSDMLFKNDQNIADYFGFGLYDTTEHEDVLSEELRLASHGDGMFRWTSGFAYRQVKLHTNLELPGFGITQDQSHHSNSYALFGEGTWAFTKQLEATLGLRLFKDDQYWHEPVDPATLALIQASNPSFTGTTSPSFHSVNPKLNVAYHVTEQWMLYTTAAKGFRTGQAQPVISLEDAALHSPPLTVPVGIDPETLWSYEVGTKVNLPDAHVTVETDVFYNHWANIQTLVFPAPGIGALINGGPARTDGAEIAVTWQPLTGLSLQVSASKVNANYLADVANTNIKDGDRIPEVPDFSLSASALYRWPISGALGGFARMGFQHTSPRTDEVNAVPNSDTINTLDMRVGVETTSWGVYLTGENLTHDEGAIDVTQSGYTGQARLRPRSIGLHVHYNYE